MAQANKSSGYTAQDIQVLKGLEGVRKRPAMYIGSTNSQGLHHLITEIVTNSIDEALCGYGNKIVVTLHKDGSCEVSDEGRGIPTGINEVEGKSALELVFRELHAGGKFNDNVYKTAAGLHGVGASVTNALSSWLDVTVYRDGEISHMRFHDGGEIETPLEVVGSTKKHGTTVRFLPDPTIFTTVDFKFDTVSDRLQEYAFLMKDVTFVLNDERSGQSVEYHYENGLVQYVETVNEDKDKLSPVIYFDDIDQETGIEVEVALQWCNQDYNETTYSYVNNARTRDGGTHEVGFKTGLTKAINDFIEMTKMNKGRHLDGSDIREGLTTILVLKIPEHYLEFEGQTKGKLGTPEATPIVNNIIYSKLTYYLNENKELAFTILKKCIDSQNARIAARKAKEEARGSSKKSKQEVILSNKLTPAQSKDYKNNELFIVEGDSAGGSAKKGRDRVHQAILPLRGKPLNTDSIAVDKLLKNEEFATIISTIGAGFGQSFDIDDIKYGKIIIMSDADSDGAHIQTLLLTFFYHYMRPLITTGHVFLAVPPLYRVYKESPGKKTIQEYCWNEEELEEAKKKVGAGYKVNRYKGLGEMNDIELKETTMDPKSRKLIQVDIEDAFLVEKRVRILMGDDPKLRKDWVEENVDFNEEDSFIKEVTNG
ncbi:MAG: type IIA DNA topoisomerase subunit B [Coprobacillus sp.]|nr:type IIA DNA topoisomerase subunit B [Coprobacillus sp.]